MQPRERSLTTSAWLALVVGAASVVGGGAVAVLDVLLHPEAIEPVSTLDGGDTLVRSHLDRWIGGARHELRRMHGDDVLASVPDWETNLVLVEHGHVLIHRPERVTVRDEHLALEAELLPAPGMAVIHTLRWLEAGRSVYVWSRPLDISRPNALEVWDVTSGARRWSAAIAGGSDVVEGSPPLLVSPYASPPTVGSVTPEGLVPLVPEPASSVCAFDGGAAWTRADGSIAARRIGGPVVALGHADPARRLDRCLACGDHLVVALEDPSAAGHLRDELARDGLDPTFPVHVIALDPVTGVPEWARSLTVSPYLFCENGVIGGL